MSVYNLYKDAKEQLAALVWTGYEKACEAGLLKKCELEYPAAEVPKDAQNGDLSSSFALSSAKQLGMPPRKIAEAILSGLAPSGYFSAFSIAGPGFINAAFGEGWYGAVLSAADALGENYGYDDIGHGRSVMVEFVSANPTGPMHLGNARGGVVGDSLASVLSRAGYKVWREFYVNDSGNQVELFALSLEARYMQLFPGTEDFPFPENGYHGDDIRELAAELYEKHGDFLLTLEPEDRRARMRDYGLARNVEKMREDLGRYKVHYDKWFFESTLHEDGYVAETIELLKSRDMLYEKDGALWFRGSEFGMEKDEVMVKSNGFFTYYAVDIAYHRDKFVRRGFDRVIDALGADHHGHTLRFKAGMAAIGVDPERLSFVLFQLVRLMQDGETVRMSKRTGKAISLSNLLDEIGVDAARFFFNSRQNGAHLEFDLGLAVRQDSENPVYYVQYAHARICTMLEKLAELGLCPVSPGGLDPALLSHPAERALIKQIAMLPEEIRLAARDLEPYRMTKYLIELASAFHVFYTEVRIKEAPPALAAARLLLCSVTRDVLKNVLSMLKISAPDKM